MLDLLIVAYTQFMIMLTELQKVLCQDLMWLCSVTTTVPSEWNVPKTMDVSLLHFYCIINKKNTLYRNVGILYTQNICTLQVHVSTAGIVIHCIGWVCQSHNSLEIQCFKWEFYVWFARYFSGIYPWRNARPACNVHNYFNLCINLFIP